MTGAINSGMAFNPYMSQYLTQAYLNKSGLMSSLNDTGGNYNSSLLDGINCLNENIDSGFNMCNYGMGTCYGMNPTKYMQYQREMVIGNAQLQGDLEDMNIQRQIARSQKQTAAEFRINGANSAVKEKLEILHRQITSNNQDNIGAAYKNLRTAVEEEVKQGGYITGNINQEFINARANELYKKTYGHDIPQSLIQYGDSSFLKGIKEGVLGLGWLITGKQSRADNISAVTGEEIPTSETALRWLGRATSALATGILAYKFLHKSG